LDTGLIRTFLLKVNNHYTKNTNTRG